MVQRFKEQLGVAIRARREELGLSQKDLAKAAHVEEPQTVSRWERGITQPGDLDAVAAALSWTVAEMMAGIQPPARVAKKAGISSGDRGAESQLDRMERMLEELVAVLVRAPESETPGRGVVAQAGAPLLEVAESRKRKAPARSPTRPADARRKRA